MSARQTTARYEGLVQFGMWLLRPRVVREFRGWLETVEYAGAYFDAILDAVDRVYANAVLRKFWRRGDLVPNRRQVLYEEGGSGRGVNVYLDGGTLYAGAWDRRVWPGTWLKCDGVRPGRWRHVAVVLRDAPPKVEPGHLLLFVDGKQVKSGGTACIGAHPGDICIG